MSAAQTDEVVEAEVVEPEPETELVVRQAQPGTLFRTDDPVEVIQRATEVANALRDVIRKQHLAVQINGRWHVLVEGWQTCGAMLGITAICEWTRPIDGGWEARVVARTLDGREVGAAEAECVKTEGKPWNTAKGHAIRSMAQTRAMSKALASVLRFVVTLAGYDGTPAEEAQAGTPSEPQSEASAQPTITAEQFTEIGELMKAARSGGLTFEQLGLIFGACDAEGPSIDRGDSRAKATRALSTEQADHVINALDAHIKGAVSDG